MHDIYIYAYIKNNLKHNKVSFVYEFMNWNLLVFHRNQFLIVSEKHI